MPAPAVFVPAELNDLRVDVQLGSAPAAGSLLVRGGAGKWIDLPPAGTDTYLRHDGAGGLTWSPLNVAHGQLSGLGNDDHPQYVLAVGGRDITGQQRFSYQGSVVDDLTQDAIRVQPSGSQQANYRPFAYYSNSGHTTPRSWMDAQGNLRIGSSNNTGCISIGGSQGDPTTTALRIARTFTSDSEVTAVQLGDALQTGTGNLRGIQLTARTQNSGTITNSRGIVVGVRNSNSTGVVTNGMGININSPTITAGGTITNCYGLKVENQNLSGTGTAYAIHTGTGIVRFGDTVGIGTSASNNTSAMLQVDSTTRGFLPPRMTTTQRDGVSSPATGLLIYNTTTNKLECYDGSTWQAAW
jgi:hypothetical protein